MESALPAERWLPTSVLCLREYNFNKLVRDVLAGIIAGKLRRPNGELPRFYQIVLKVKYKDAVPTEVSYVLHRELRAERRPARLRRTNGGRARQQRPTSPPPNRTGR